MYDGFDKLKWCTSSGTLYEVLDPVHTQFDDHMARQRIG